MPSQETDASDTHTHPVGRSLNVGCCYIHFSSFHIFFCGYPHLTCPSSSVVFISNSIIVQARGGRQRKIPSSNFIQSPGTPLFFLPISWATTIFFSIPKSHVAPHSWNGKYIFLSSFDNLCDPGAKMFSFELFSFLSSPDCLLKRELFLAL